MKTLLLLLGLVGYIRAVSSQGGGAVQPKENGKTWVLQFRPKVFKFLLYSIHKCICSAKGPPKVINTWRQNWVIWCCNSYGTDRVNTPLRFEPKSGSLHSILYVEQPQWFLCYRCDVLFEPQPDHNLTTTWPRQSWHWELILVIHNKYARHNVGADRTKASVTYSLGIHIVSNLRFGFWSTDYNRQNRCEIDAYCLLLKKCCHNAFLCSSSSSVSHI